MSAFSDAYVRLNGHQKQAVDQIDGPVLVVAGPGTGKTQLLSARVANILTKTDTLPQNILCLTFTESGASNMRERLTRFIGQAAYDVTIGTYHAFGGDLIQRFPEYFGEHRLQSPVDELNRRQVVAELVARLPYGHPLKSTQHHLHDLLSTLSEIKQGLLDESDLRVIAAENGAFLQAAESQVQTAFAGVNRLPGSYAKAVPYFEALQAGLAPLTPAIPASTAYRPLAEYALEALQRALDEAAATSSSKPLTAFKNAWLVKDSQDRFVFKGLRENERIAALADMLGAYGRVLEANGWYDFDDMILRSIRAMETHDDLRFSLQEQYLYILLDEFQDTNAAQLKLVRLLTDNPMSEGRPNVMAVGDDDQAIYAFQGAKYSNMRDFKDLYRDTLVVPLTENYRSHGDILSVAHKVASQIGSRLTEADLQGLSKTLTTGRAWSGQALIDRHEFISDVGQHDWMANEIAALIQNGTPASRIAVLAPRHKQLEPLVPFLNGRNIAVRYEKRDNILETPIVRQLLVLSRLVLALKDGDDVAADALWPEVLSYDFWQLGTVAIWQLSWQVRDEKPRGGWAQALLANAAFRLPGLLLLTLAGRVERDSLETMLDYLIGSEAVSTNDIETPLVQSPLRTYYTASEYRQAHPDDFYDTLSHLTVLRQKLRDHQQASDHTLGLPDLLRFVDMYEAAGERMLNTSPYNQQAEAVQLMTVFKAKGLEFEHVFLPSLQDDVWGDSSRGNANRLTLPANLAPIRHAGATADERLRIFFVAVTRAKQGLHLTSYLSTFSGKAGKRLKYLDEQEQAEGGYISRLLPAFAQQVTRIESESIPPEALQYNWRQRHWQGLAEQQLQELLQHRLDDFRLSASQLGSFVDMIHAGPESFFLNNLLRFPQASGAAAAYGTAIHATLQELQQRVNASRSITLPELQQYFSVQLAHQKLSAQEAELRLGQGRAALSAYWAARRDTFVAGNRPEVDLWPDNVTLDGGIRLSGKLDRIDLNKADRTITIIDYKTGKPFTSWSKSDDKAHRYSQQLYFYRLLLQHSRTYRDWQVSGARLEFIEPDDDGLIQTLELRFDDKEAARQLSLVKAVWKRIMQLDLPDTAAYDLTLAGTRAFEARLLDEA